MSYDSEEERIKFESVVSLDDGVYWSEEEETYVCTDRHSQEGGFEAMTLFKGWLLCAMHREGLFK